LLREELLLTATDGHRGVQMARDLVPDLILMDINLPGLSGYDALAILQADPATARIPVMALSARAAANDIKKGMEAGFCRYMTKPIKVVDSMDALDSALRDLIDIGQPE
jgi:CheY-like chemotaxis protein